MALPIVSLIISLLSLVTGILRLSDNYQIQMFAISGIALTIFVISSYLYNKNRNTLKAYPKRPKISFEDELGNAKEIWLAWHTGSVKVAQGDIFNSPRRIRLILTHPKSNALREIAKSTDLSFEKLSYDVQELSKIAKNNGCKVGWYDGLIGNSSIIINPEKNNAWARIETFIPFIEPAARPSIKCSHKNSNDLFENLKKSYENMWELSEKVK